MDDQTIWNKKGKLFFLCFYSSIFEIHVKQSMQLQVYAHDKTIKVHVHRPHAVTLNETLEEFDIPTGLCQKI
jgi:hypothetical protein